MNNVKQYGEKTNCTTTALWEKRAKIAKYLASPLNLMRESKFFVEHATTEANDTATH